MNQENSSDDVIVDETQNADGSVTAEDQNQDQEEPTSDVTADQDNQDPGISNLEIDRPQKNYDSEWRRKYERLEAEFNSTKQEIPELIRESVQNSISQEQSQKKYTTEHIPQLRAYAEENPHHAAWAQSEIDRINREAVASEIRKEITQRDEERSNAQLKQQAEQAVLNDSRYAEAFVKLPNGNKTWNPNSKLAQTMAAYMNDPRINSQPDGIMIAAKLARADSLDNTAQLNSLKRENAGLKKQNLVEGGGVNSTPKDELSQAKDQLRKSGSEKDAQAALSAMFKRRNN